MLLATRRSVLEGFVMGFLVVKLAVKSLTVKRLAVRRIAMIYHFVKVTAGQRIAVESSMLWAFVIELTSAQVLGWLRKVKDCVRCIICPSS